MSDVCKLVSDQHKRKHDTTRHGAAQHNTSHYSAVPQITCRWHKERPLLKDMQMIGIAQQLAYVEISCLSLIIAAPQRCILSYEVARKEKVHSTSLEAAK